MKQLHYTDDYCNWDDVNCDDSTPTAPSDSSATISKGLPTVVVAGSLSGVFLLLIIGFLALIYWYIAVKKRAIIYDQQNEESGISNGTPADTQMMKSPKRNDLSMSVEFLKRVTQNFNDDNVLGRGGFGVIYKGELLDGTKIAIKRMECQGMSDKGLAEFNAEIEVLTKVRHRHLVTLLGYCSNDRERFLVYEYMPKGNLAEHLFQYKSLGYPPLTWKQRVNIALDVARGVEYLHTLARDSFIHRDLKPSNILLGDDMRAKVADFGLAKSAPYGKSVQTKLAGTFGYLPPEYAATGRVTAKVDVYAYGAVLMEMITGRKALDEKETEERSHLVTWFRKSVRTEKEELLRNLDQTLQQPDEETYKSILEVAELAMHCTTRDPLDRPHMGHAVKTLSQLVEEWKPSSWEDDDGCTQPLPSLQEALQRWQADEGTSKSAWILSQSSIPSKSSEITLEAS